MTRARGVRFAAVGIGPGLPARRRQLIVRNTCRRGKEEPRERGVEYGDVVHCAGENGSKGVADGALVGEIDNVEHTSGVLQFSWPDAKAVLAAQRLAECGEILRQAGEWIHQRRGADTEPMPKSVSRLYPPDSRFAGTSPRNGSSAARCALL